MANTQFCRQQNTFYFENLLHADLMVADLLSQSQHFKLT